MVMEEGWVVMVVMGVREARWEVMGVRGEGRVMKLVMGKGWVKEMRVD